MSVHLTYHCVTTAAVHIALDVLYYELMSIMRIMNTFVGIVCQRRCKCADIYTAASVCVCV